MPKVRTTISLDEDVFRAVEIKAARTGKRNSQVIEESLRRGLGLDELAKIWAGVRPADEDKGLALAANELRHFRTERRGEGGP